MLAECDGDGDVPLSSQTAGDGHGKSFPLFDDVNVEDVESDAPPSMLVPPEAAEEAPPRGGEGEASVLNEKKGESGSSKQGGRV